MIEKQQHYSTSTFMTGGCRVTTGLTTGGVTLYDPGPGVIKFGGGKRFVFKGNN